MRDKIFYNKLNIFEIQSFAEFLNIKLTKIVKENSVDVEKDKHKDDLINDIINSSNLTESNFYRIFTIGKIKFLPIKFEKLFFVESDISSDKYYITYSIFNENVLILYPKDIKTLKDSFFFQIDKRHSIIFAISKVDKVIDFIKVRNIIVNDIGYSQPTRIHNFFGERKKALQSIYNIFHQNDQRLNTLVSKLTKVKIIISYFAHRIESEYIKARVSVSSTKSRIGTDLTASHYNQEYQSIQIIDLLSKNVQNKINIPKNISHLMKIPNAYEIIDYIIFNIVTINGSKNKKRFLIKIDYERIATKSNFDLTVYNNDFDTVNLTYICRIINIIYKKYLRDVKKSNN